MFEYFKLVAANLADFRLMEWLFQTKIFYPETGSTPALPGSVSTSFDYRELVKMWQLNREEMSIIVVTRSRYSLANFSINVIPTADWTARYGFSSAPTITSIATDFNIPSLKSSPKIFLNYEYPGGN